MAGAAVKRRRGVASRAHQALRITSDHVPPPRTLAVWSYFRDCTNSNTRSTTWFIHASALKKYCVPYPLVCQTLRYCGPLISPSFTIPCARLIKHRHGALQELCRAQPTTGNLRSKTWAEDWPLKSSGEDVADIVCNRSSGSQ